MISRVFRMFNLAVNCLSCCYDSVLNSMLNAVHKRLGVDSLHNPTRSWASIRHPCHVVNIPTYARSSHLCESHLLSDNRHQPTRWVQQRQCRARCKWRQEELFNQLDISLRVHSPLDISHPVKVYLYHHHSHLLVVQVVTIHNRHIFKRVKGCQPTRLSNSCHSNKHGSSNDLESLQEY